MDIDLHMYQYHVGAEKLRGNGSGKLVLVEMAANHRMKLLFVNKLSSFKDSLVVELETKSTHKCLAFLS